MSTEEFLNKDVPSDHQNHLKSLKSRLEKYKIKNELITQKEIEEEALYAEKQAQEKEKQERLEAERKLLFEELQRIEKSQKVEMQKTTISDTQQAITQPQQQTIMDLHLELQQHLQRQRPGQPSYPEQKVSLSNTMSFGYPTTVTEKEAINWLKNGF